MAGPDKVLVWPWWVRLCHWTLVLGFIANYFLLDPGSDLHNWLGYLVAALVALRVMRGLFSSPGYASLDHCDLGRRAFRQHLGALKARQLPKNEGHYPLGWVMVIIIWCLVGMLTITGFLMEEIDYFFGSTLLDNLHLWSADALLVAALVHILAVLLVGYWGRVALIRPMITGSRELR